MSDCFDAKCCCPDCSVNTPIHLGDYTGREEIEVYCGKHIPRNISDGILYAAYLGPGRGYYDMKEIYIRALTETSINNWESNYPNVENQIYVIRVFGKSPINAGFC